LKRAISSFLVCILICVTIFSVSGCKKADQSGEWGAYYQAFCAFSGEMDKDTRYVCLDQTGIAEENHEKLYDLFDEFCDDESMKLTKGDWVTLYGERLIDDAGNFTDGYLVSFLNVSWSKDRTEVTLVVSMRTTLTISEANLGGSVTVTKTDDGWQAKKNDDAWDLTGKVGAYFAVLDYFANNAGMSGLKSILALDPYGVEADVLPELEKLLVSYMGRQKFRFMKATWDGLKEHGYLDGADYFTDGYFLSFDSVEWIDESKLAEITGWMSQGNLNALGGVFTVEQIDGVWQVTDVQTMMS